MTAIFWMCIMRSSQMWLADWIVCSYSWKSAVIQTCLFLDSLLTSNLYCAYLLNSTLKCVGKKSPLGDNKTVPFGQRVTGSSYQMSEGFTAHKLSWYITIYTNTLRNGSGETQPVWHNGDSMILSLGLHQVYYGSVMEVPLITNWTGVTSPLQYGAKFCLLHLPHMHPWRMQASISATPVRTKGLKNK